MAAGANSIGRTFQTADLSGWYAIHTRSRHEKVVDRLLAESGFETFLPVRTVCSRLSLRRMREAQFPLFPGYTFARFSCSPENYHRVRATTGVAGIVGSSAAPVSIPDIEMASLRSVLNQNLEYRVNSHLAPGRRVVICAGPLRGVEGEIVKRKNEQLFVVKVHLIQRMLEIDFEALELETVIQ